MTVTTNTVPIRTVTKIVTFYSDGTFSEHTPAPMPFTVAPAPHTYPWWQGPISGTIDGNPNSKFYGVPNTSESKPV